jgi:hypothetical protein
MELVLAFVAGMIVMDLMWALKLRIPQAMYYRYKHRNDPPVVYSYEGEAE